MALKPKNSLRLCDINDFRSWPQRSKSYEELRIVDDMNDSR